MANDQVLYGDIRTAPREFLKESFTQQFEQIFREYCQLRIDLRSANENRFSDNEIRISVDFMAMYENFKRLPLEKQQEFLAPLFEDDGETGISGI